MVGAVTSDLAAVAIAVLIVVALVVRRTWRHRRRWTITITYDETEGADDKAP